MANSFIKKNEVVTDRIKREGETKMVELEAKVKKLEEENKVLKEEATKRKGSDNVSTTSGAVSSGARGVTEQVPPAAEV